MNTITFAKNKKAVHATAIEDCEKHGMNFYIVKRDSIIAAKTKAALRAIGKNTINSSGLLPFNSENPETWCAEWVSGCRYYKEAGYWTDQKYAKSKGLPIPQ